MVDVKMAYPPHLAELIQKKAETDAGYAIAHALLRLANAQESLAHQVKYLGNGDAPTKLGALHAFHDELCKRLDVLVSTLSSASPVDAKESATKSSVREIFSEAVKNRGV